MSDKAFLDTNILIYAASVDEPEKAAIAEGILKMGHLVSPQVIFECFNVLLKKHRLSKDQAIQAIRGLTFHTSTIPEDDLVVMRAIRIYKEHLIHPYDAKIIATAISAGCSILYSEDMQHGLVVEDSLTIINPFR